MNLPRADAALEACASHLNDTGSRNTQVDAILTLYVSAVIYAAFERKAREIVAARAEGDGSDPHLAAFARTASRRLMRSIKIGELAGVAGYFHTDCKDRFHDLLAAEASAAWDNIINNRHEVAHEDDVAQVMSNFTFTELETLYPKAMLVLDALEKAIARPPPAATVRPVSAEDTPGSPIARLRAWSARRRQRR